MAQYNRDLTPQKAARRMRRANPELSKLMRSLGLHPVSIVADKRVLTNVHTHNMMSVKLIDKEEASNDNV